MKELILINRQYYEESSIVILYFKDFITDLLYISSRLRLASIS